eukprot:5306248-Pleurochrysis_carterae.AAC.1
MHARCTQEEHATRTPHARSALGCGRDRQPRLLMVQRASTQWKAETFENKVQQTLGCGRRAPHRARQRDFHKRDQQGDQCSDLCHTRLETSLNLHVQVVEVLAQNLGKVPRRALCPSACEDAELSASP